MDSRDYLHFLYGSKDGLPEWQRESHVIDASHEMRTRPLPERYQGTSLGNYLLQHSADPNGVYAHQAIAAAELDAGNNVVLSTTTGSGKSRAFMTEGFDLIMRDPSAQVLVLTPLVQLNKDQTLKWQEMAKGLELPDDCIGSLYGAVPMEERPEIIGKSRILLATPDITHAYMMSNLGKPEIRDFLANRKLTVLDEIDSYHAGFGTNMAYLLRRMQYVQQALTGSDFSEHRYIGASATLPNPDDFFKKLTGQNVINIPEELNGAPRPERTIVHHSLDRDDKLGQAERIISHMLSDRNMGQGIVFIDSRAKVEDVAARINERFGDDTAVVQKAGLQPEEQNHIDYKMRSGEARVVIATSSMEAGVDHDFQWGMNVELPAALTSLKQRIGRVGRKQSGLFIVLAHRGAMGYYEQGVNRLEQYLSNTPLEEPQLYLNNEFIQIAQALCLTNEAQQLHAAKVTLHPAPKGSAVEWPRGFISQLAKAKKPEAHLTGEKSILLPPPTFKNRKQKVHHFHTLRNISSGSMFLSRPHARSRDYQILGSIDADQALREFPPGAIAWHGQKKWRVWSWKANKIVMTPYSGTNRTRHNMGSFMSIRITNDNITPRTFRVGPEAPAHNEQKGWDRNLMTIVRGQTAQTVTSFVEWDTKKDRSETYAYVFKDDHELNGTDLPSGAIDYGPKRRSAISTTGLLMYLPEIEDKYGRHRKDGFYSEILDEFCAAMSYERHNVNCTDKGYATLPDGTVIKGMRYFYDTTAGSLGLTHGLVKDKQHNIYEIVRRIQARTSGTKQRTYWNLCDDFLKAWEKMEVVEPGALFNQSLKDIEAPKGSVLVVPPGQYGYYNEYRSGVSQKVKVVKPVIVSDTPGYYIEQFNRKAAFKSTEFVTYNKRTGKIKLPERPQGYAVPSTTQTFISAAFVSPQNPSNVIAMHKETGKLTMQDPEKEGHWVDYQESVPA